MGSIKIEPRAGGCTFQVQVVPRASRNQIVGIIDGAVKLKIAAPPVDGAANEACLRFFSRFLDVSKSNVALLAGEHHRRKTVFVRGCSLERARSFFEAALRQD
jgi:uncharacterized protein (TIGR00251 family)